MRRFRPVFLSALVLVAALGIMVSGCETDKAARRDVNFQQVIEHAKSEVFPCVVFVKPIQEDYRAGERRRQQVLGSGVIVSPDGLVVTNNHVAEKATEIKCVLSNRQQVEAEVVGLDPETDMAVLRLKLPKDHEPLPFIQFADSDKVEAGEFVMALGSPYGFERSISLGIVSNAKRYIGFETIYKYNTWIQTDAAINPGNSGGPLVDIQGRVIGINTLAGQGYGLGFAIPSNLVQKVMKRIVRDGKVVRSWTGIHLQALKDFNSDTFVDAKEGVLISDVDPDSPASEAGIRPKDLLIAVNEQKLTGTYVEDLPAIRWILADLPVGKPSTFVIERRGENGEAKQFKLKIVPTEKGKFEGKDFDCRKWNMTVKEISRFRDPDLYFYKKRGVYIRGIRYPGNANNAGLQRKDIIVSIDNKPVETLEDVKRIYEQIVNDKTRDKKVLFEILRNGYRVWKVLDYATDYSED